MTSSPGKWAPFKKDVARASPVSDVVEPWGSSHRIVPAGEHVLLARAWALDVSSASDAGDDGRRQPCEGVSQQPGSAGAEQEMLVIINFCSSHVAVRMLVRVRSVLEHFCIAETIACMSGI